MSATDLLKDLSRLGVELWTEGDQLRFRSPGGVLTAELRDQLGAHRDDLLSLLNRKPVNGSAEPLLAPDPANLTQPFPLTDIQQAYWIGRGSAFELGNVAAHSYVELEREGLDINRLENALQKLVERHAMLRSIILPDGTQRILSDVRAHIPRTNLRHLPGDSVELELHAIREQMSHQALPLETWPPFEIRATLLDRDRIRLHISFDLIVCDASSFQIFFSELATLYRDPDSSLPAIDISFRDYVLASQRIRDAQSERGRYRRAQAYWRGRLESLPPAPQLPLAVNSATIAHPRFIRRSARLARPFWESLHVRARQSGVTASGVLLTAFGDVLALWTRSQRFTLNLTVFNRPPWHEHIDLILGDFTSTALLAIDYGTENQERSFLARVRAVQNRLWEDLEHSSVNGIEVARQLGRLRGTGSASLPVVFTSLLRGETSDWEAHSRAVLGHVVFGISQTPQVLLDHQVMDSDGDLVWNWDAVEEAFPAGLLDGIFESYCAWLNRLARDAAAWDENAGPQLPAAQLERRRQVNDTSAQLREDESQSGLLYSGFLDRAQNRPEAEAVITPTVRLTYGELHRRASSLGAALQAHGAASGQLVAVVMEKGWEQVVGVLGILSTGAAYVPIDPGLPAERIAYLLEDSAVRIAVTQPHLDGRLNWPESIGRIVVRADEPHDLAPWPQSKVSPESLAYVIYTSGSTGLPKGVMIDHRGPVNTIADVNRRFAVGPHDRVFAVSALNFDLSVYDIFGALDVGAAIVFPSVDDLRDPDRWREQMDRERVTIWNSVPALMEMLAEASEGSTMPLPVSLRLVLLSGDWIPVSLPDRVRALAPQAEIIGMGGATEASIWSILYSIGKVDPRWKSIPYGRPMANQRFDVLTPELDPSPDWVPGELYIGGTGLMLGYWGNPEETQRRLVIHPRTGRRLYRTGDLGRWLPEGDIEFLGREDFQVKIQGHRIELGEIEAALVRHPDIREAVAAAPLLPSGKRQLVAYVVPSAMGSGELFTEESTTESNDLAWQALLNGARARSQHLPENLNGAAGALDAADRIARAYMCNALRSMEMFANAGESHTAAALCRELGILPGYHRLFENWLIALSTEGLLSAGADGTFTCAEPLPELSRDALETELSGLNKMAGEAAHLLGYVRLSGASLPALLRGEADPLELFFPGGSWERAQSWYQANPMAAFYNEIAAAAVAGFAVQWPPDRKLRVLELGAGTGGTTSCILPVLAPERTEYTVTDVSGFFTRQAEEKFGHEPWIHYDLLDINQDPARQGYRAHAYDIVLGANVVHNAHNLDCTLAWVRSLLTPEGVLLLLEGTRNTHLQMITVGFLEGFAEAGRTGLPLLGAGQWREALVRNCFAECTWFPQPDSSHADLGQHVIVGRAPRAVRRLSTLALREFLSERLPAYMIPPTFLALEAMPLSANGKVDRKAFSSMSAETAEEHAEVAAPRNQLEASLVRVWAETLGVESVGIHSNFFSLGGDSLLAMQVVRKAREECGLAVPLRRLFETPTIAGLALAATRADEPDGRSNDNADEEEEFPRAILHPADRNQVFPLTDVQQAYALGRTNAFELGGVATQNYMEIDVVYLDLDRFVRVWHRLIDRHDMLRAIIHSNGTQQILATVPPYRVQTLDLRSMPAAETDARLLEMREQLSHETRPADQWPLFEIRVTLLAENRARLHYRYDALIGDAWSAVILSRDFALLYEDPGRTLPDLELSFRDYVLALEHMPHTSAWNRAQKYWQSRAATMPPAPDLPLAANPATLESPRFTRFAAELAPERWQAIRQRAGAANVTPSAVLLAAFSEVLALWSRSPRFSLNLTLFNRLPLHPQIDSIVGDFTALILVGVDAAHERSFSEGARSLQHELWQAMDHRIVSGVRVLRELARIAGGRPRAAMPVVFTSALGMDDMERDLFSSGLDGRVVYGISQTPQVWLDHQVMEQGGALVFNWDVVEGLFPGGMIEAMFTAYCGLLHELAGDENLWERSARPQLPPAELAERQLANATATELPVGLLHEGFLEEAALDPSRTAVICGPHRITYGQLRRSSAGIASWLRAHGAQPGRLAAVVMEKGWEQVAAALGVLQAGMAYLPIDAALPQARIDYLLGDGQARLVLTQPQFVETLSWPEGVEVLAVDSGIEASGIEAEPGMDAIPAARSGDLAYVIYTSGSTGQPKGVMIEHGSARNTIAAVNRRLSLGRGDRVLGLSSLSFDLSVWDIFGTLTAGATLVLPEAGAERDAERWLELIVQEGITIWNSVPALMELLVESIEAQGKAGPRAASLRTVLLSGDWIPLRLPERMRAAGLDAKAISMGGATEASIWSIWHTIDEPPPGEWSSVAYGRPLQNQQFHVLNEAFDPCPMWVAGELYIGGAGLARGYWRAAEKTAQRFIDHPEYGRLYRTGDLGRYRPGGVIEFLGREDAQVKIQGHRIELGEIEAALAAEAGVREAVVTVRSGASGHKRLAGYVVAEPGATAEQLRAGLGRKLPAYMIPADWVLLDRLPLTANGKVDRKALPEPGAAAPTQNCQSPRTPVERELARLWSETLAIPQEQINIHQPFLAAGGDSLLAVQLVAAAAQHGLRFSLRNLFRCETIAALAQIVEHTPTPVSGRSPDMDEDGFHNTGHPALIHHAASPLSLAAGKTLWETVVESGRTQACALPPDIDFTALGAGFRFLDRLSNAYVCRALLSLGVFRSGNEWYTADQVAERGQVLPAYYKLLQRWLDALAEDGLLMRDGQKYGSTGPLSAGTVEAIWMEGAALALKVPEPVIRYLKRSGESLSDIVSGRVHALEVFFEGGTTEVQEWLYQHGPGMTYLNGVAASILRSASQSWPAERPLRILEVGAGIGGTTAWLLPELPAGRVSYTYTDLSNYFMNLARRKFSAYSFVEYGLLNVELDPVAQGFTPGSFEIVVAANVLHGARDLAAAVEHVRSLLSPGGTLLLLEGTRNDRLHNFTVGLIEGWSRFEDGRVDDNLPLLAREDWETVLSEHGFQDITMFPEAGSPAEVIGQNVMVARLSEPLSTSNETDQTATEVGLAHILPSSEGRHDPFPLTDVQHAYWIGRSASFALGNVSAHIYLELSCRDLDLDRFTRAWQTLIDRHDMLRAIVLDDGTQQILAHVLDYQPVLLDLRARPEFEVSSELGRTRHALSHQVRPADQWPLFEIRASLIDRVETRLHISFDLLIADGWSLQLLVRELVQTYLEPEADLTPLTLSFRDCVLAEKDLENTTLYTRARDYWLSRLSTMQPGPALPLSCSPESIKQPSFTRISASLDTRAWERIKEAGRRKGLTSSIVLCTAFAEVLGRWLRSPRFTLNLTIFNRPAIHPEVNSIVGDFTSLILLAVDNTVDGGFLDRARCLQQQLWTDLEHRHFSGVRVLRELAHGPDGGAYSGMPVVFTSGLPLESIRDNPHTLDRMGEVVSSISQTPQVWLDHQVMEQGGALVFNWDVVEGLFPGGMIEAMFTAYCGLLHELAGDENLWERSARPQLPPAELAERQLANATATELPGGLLHEGFLEEAALDPSRTAVICGPHRITYGQLRRSSAGIASWLRAHGAQPGRLAAVVMEKGWEQVAAALGVLQAGMAYLPIDAALPQARIDYLLGDGQARLVLTQPQFVETLSWPEGVEVLAVDSGIEASGIEAEPGMDAIPAARSGDLAYVIYTSGSTGQPKGVMIEHGSARNTIAAVNRRLSLGRGDRVLGLSSLSFDLSVWDIFGTLTAGATLVLPEAGAERDAERWLELIVQEGITIWNSVPALMELLVESIEAQGKAGPRAASLRTVLLSGDWIPLRLPERMRAAGLDAKAISMGGATEASIWSIWHTIDEPPPGEWSSVAYGRPLQNQQFHVLNEAFDPCPMWVAGELYIGGAGLARGYWRAAEKTAQRFIDHPEYGRLYRTGDLGRYRPGGVIEFLGREDAQVKIQGHRIELGEIEAALAAEAGVREAVVTVRSGASGHKRLAGYVVAEPGATAEQLRAGLGRKLPAYMIPADWVLLDRLPLTANGKVDRKALPEPGAAAPTQNCQSPRTPVERELARLWSETLAIPQEQINIHQPFLAAGGDSLLAVQLVAKIKTSFEVDLSLRRFFQAGSIANLAEAVEELLYAEIEKMSDEEALRLLEQERLHG